jgi:hypothetical protein
MSYFIRFWVLGYKYMFITSRQDNLLIIINFVE